MHFHLQYNMYIYGETIIMQLLGNTEIVKDSHVLLSTDGVPFLLLCTW